MKTYVSAVLRLLAIVPAAFLIHPQPALADGCDLPTFGGARLFGAASDSQAFATGDFNGDGFADLAVLNVTGSVSVLLGNGDGTFRAAVNYPFTSPNYVAAADFNGDGKVDLAVSANLRIYVMLGKGDGSFQDPILGSASQPTTAMAVGDFNGDGKPDLAIVGTPAYILLGKGDGTFANAVTTPGSPLAVTRIAIGDFNGDGKLDVVAGGQTGIYVMLGDGKGGLSSPANFNAGTSFLPDGLAVGDVNGDHKLDVVTVTSLNNKVSVMLGNGNGTFQTGVTYAVGDLANAVAIADLTGDGVPDLAVANHAAITAPGTISIYPGNGDGTFQTPVQYYPTVQANWALAAGDFNLDGVADLVFTSIVQNQPTQVGVMLGNGDGTFQSPKGYTTGGQLPRKPVLADFNGDGVLDMAVANAGIKGNLSVLLGNPDGSFQDAVTYPTALGAKSVAVGDMNGDGIQDLVVANGSSSNLLVFLGNGDGTFQSPTKTGSLFLTTYLTLGDFNNDGKLDAAVIGIQGAQIVLGNGDGTFRGSFTSYGGSCAGCGQGPVTAADLNGDGNLDLVLSNGDTDMTFAFGRSGTVTVLLGKGDGTFLAPKDYTIGSNASATAVGDLNGDGIPDLAAVDFGGGNGNNVTVPALAVLFGNGDGTFQDPVKYATGKGASSVVIGDFDGDTVNDVAVLSRSSKTITAYMGVGDGTLRNSITYGAGGDPVALTMADINGDSKPDLLVGDQLTNSVLTLLNVTVPGVANSACTAVAPLAK